MVIVAPFIEGYTVADVNRVVKVVVAVVAIAAQAVLIVPFSVASGLFAPTWAWVLFNVAALAAAGTQIWFLTRRRVLAAFLVPVVHGTLFFASVTAGDVLLGWTA